MKIMKDAIRKEVKKILASLTAQEKEKQSKLITSKLLSLPEYQKSNRVSVYLHMDDEVRTSHILEDIFHTGKICFIPRYATDSTHMDMLRVNTLQELESLPLTKWNIRQPLISDERENALNSGGLDLIVVPGLAFSHQGARLGRGKGYYDTYLTKCRQLQNTPPVTVGIAFKQQVLDNIPTQEFDVKMDHVLFME
uniref:5-formyltetrahydrofolate cyclo-ligase n=1 Tax=Timema bartmani TaxID=61472 RepID=A0A7R9I6F7_9NEOP|nr:unnamed protein product [Timema bartmani]